MVTRVFILVALILAACGDASPPGFSSGPATTSWEFAGLTSIAYPPSKAALNMVTVQFAKELRGTGITVNVADPGYTATDLNGHQGP